MNSLTELPAWATSLVVHILILALLASLTMVVISEPEFAITTMIDDQALVEDYKFDSTVVNQVGNDSPANMVSSSLAAARQLGQNPQQEMEEKLEEKLKFREPVIETIPEPSRAELLATFDTTGATEHPGGTQGAIDRLAMEIAGSLRERKTLVVWLFDASLSLEKRREAIADRFETVYRQLTMMNATKDDALRTAAFAFGQKIDLLTSEPTSDYKKLAKTVRNIKSDTSGLEYVFTAVDTAFRRFESYRRKSRRNMMFIVVTDERGNDYGRLEEVINKLRRAGTRVYCVGNAAVFGREKGYIKTTWEADGETFTKDLPADQGPETVAAERLQLTFWTARNRWLENMSSGYGPYALTRLCAESPNDDLVASIWPESRA